MYTPVVNVAKNRFLDSNQLVEFAENNRALYGITGHGEHAVIGTWHVNDLVDAFKEQLGEDYEEHRRSNIEAALQPRSYATKM